MPYPENKAFPFCTPRCKLIDLGNWLDGRYLLAMDPAADVDGDLEAALRDEALH